MDYTNVLVLCARCGAEGGDKLPLDWAFSTERGRTLAYCSRCARENVRAIEARLDAVHW
jgi:hypothetical protein